jgi:hypothetical protein
MFMCCFLLDIHHRHMHPGETTHNPMPITSLNAAAQQAGGIVVEEFGEPQPHKEAIELKELCSQRWLWTVLSLRSLETWQTQSK